MTEEKLKRKAVKILNDQYLSTKEKISKIIKLVEKDLKKR